MNITWEDVLSSASQLQKILPEAVLVGGTASAVFAGHRISSDADHVITDLREHFEDVLSDLESVAGWETARIKKPVLILGSLDGIETGIRQLVRKEPLETTEIDINGQKITLPTLNEMLRIKGILILKRNAARDYLDFAALSDGMEDKDLGNAMLPFDRLYPQDNDRSATRQLLLQLAMPKPFDLEEPERIDWNTLNDKWKDWDAVEKQCQKTAQQILIASCHQ